MEVLSISPLNWVVVLATVVELKVLLDPLSHLGVVEQPALDQLVDLQVLLDAILLEGFVKQLVVVVIFVLVLGSPLH